ncbi:hypothetical protein KAR91_40415 [Candidatus Pacearchaeota archaeon]|nr:hypothetical protein [Candidatus Pacearchaeota archaeon]
MFNLLKKHREKKKQEARINGYNWAAGALLRGEETPMSIDAYTSGNDRTEFDFGAEEACNKLINLGVIVNDIIF